MQAARSNKLTRRLTAGFVGAVVVASLASPAVAATDESTLSIIGGSLSAGTPAVGNFSVTLDGTAKTVGSTMAAFDAVDGRGTGVGWNMTVKATDFCEWDATLAACKVGGKKLASDSLTMGLPTVAKKDATSSTAPGITKTAQFSIDTGAAGSAVEFAKTSAAGDGMGSYTFTTGDVTGMAGSQVKVSIPASAYATSYRSNVTVTIATLAL